MVRCKDCARKNECVTYIFGGEPIVCFDFIHEGETSTDINLKQNIKNPLNDSTKVCKDVEGKLPVHLVPPEAVKAMAKVFGFGARKYSPRGWEAGMEFEDYLAAAERHLLELKEGNMIDEESGMPHLFHALTDFAILTTYYERGLLEEIEDENLPYPQKRIILNPKLK